ncbi:MAG: NUDIX domain-containing protein [Chloroflexota bacterium]
MGIDRTSLPEISEQIKKSWQPQRVDYSSGGVAYRLDVQGSQESDDRRLLTSIESQTRIALIATHGGKRWQLPKGTVEDGETSLEAAIREVEEESGLQTEFNGFIETVEYWYWDTFNRVIPMLVRKRVDFYLLRVIGGELSDLSIEVDAVAWFTPEQALNRMTFKAERAIVRTGLAQLQK